jgi:hypothetical protein
MLWCLTILILLASCNPAEQKAVDDFIEGEASTAEKVIQDLSAPSSPQAPVSKPVDSPKGKDAKSGKASK